MTTSRFVNISTLFLVIAAFGPAPAKSQSAPPAAPVSAHDVPARSIRIVGPFRPAGFPDRIARVLAAEMRQTQRVFVENRPGAGGMIGAAEVARAAPDGTALVITTMPALLIAPLVNPRPDFRPIEEFSHIAYIGGPPTAFVVASTSKIQSFADLVRVAKENPQSYGTGGVGSVGNFAAAYVGNKADIKLIHIPYNGPMLGDIISGVVDFGALTASTVMGNIDGGTLRALAVGTDKRLEKFPVVPTLKELGFDISPISWLAISGPAGMPRELQMTLNRQIAVILSRPKVVEVLKQELIEPIRMSPQELTAFIKSEIAKWTPIVDSIGLRK